MTDRIANALIQEYGSKLTEPHRPPSRGGNTKARHSHWFVIDGAQYWFIASGSKKWVFKHDRVSFNFERKDGYLQIVSDTLEVRDRDGKVVVRGQRGRKAQLRTATTRPPVSRREARD